MPDLITHVAFTHLVKRPFELKGNENNIFSFRVILYLGAILPDITTRPWYIVFPATKSWTASLHTPFSAILCCALLSLFFHPGIRKKVFLYLLLGVILHFFLDTFSIILSGRITGFFHFPGSM